MQRIGARRLARALFVPLAFLAAPALAITELRHAHGLGYSPDGSRILIPNHHGIAVYSDGRWSKAPGPTHDYMGFVVTREFIFSSGHLEGSRGGANPLGLMRSGDVAAHRPTTRDAAQAKLDIVCRCRTLRVCGSWAS